MLNKYLGLSVNHAIYDHNLIKNCQLYTLDKLASKELYNVSLCLVYRKPILQCYSEKLLKTKNIHFTKKSFSKCKFSYVSVQNFE